MLKMLKRLTDVLQLVRWWYLSDQNQRLLTWTRRIVVSGILAASFWFIGKRLVSDYSSLSEADMRLEPYRLIASWLCVTASTALGAWEWSLLVNALGGNLDTLSGTRAHLVSNLTKYVPGGVWSYLGKVYSATKQGTPLDVATVSVIGEFFIVFVDGILVIILSLPYSALNSWSPAWRLALQITAILFSVGGIGSILLMGPKLVNSATVFDGREVNWGQVAFVTAAILFNWALLGLGFRILGTSRNISTMPHISHQFLTLALGMLAGQIAFFVPIGLGVREAVFVGLLSTWYPTAFVLVVALVFRIEMVLGELVCALVAVGTERLAMQGE